MNLGEQGRQRSQYRKGVLLGLTVAEAMLLILFALMLALGVLVAQKDENIRELQVNLTRAGEALMEAETRAEVFEALASGETTDQFIHEIILAREERARVDQEREELEALATEIAQNQQLAEAIAQAGGDDAERIRELAALGARISEEAAAAETQADRDELFELAAEAMALAEAAQAAGQDADEARELMNDGARAARENATLRGQIARFRDQLQRIGRGGELPPCWVTEEGQIEYILDIDLLGSNQLRVRDVTPVSRTIDRRSLPISPALFGGPLSPRQFLDLTRPLYEYGQGRDCRFYVIARDRTGPTQKGTFQQLLLTVEGHFYKWLRI